MYNNVLSYSIYTNVFLDLFTPVHCFVLEKLLIKIYLKKVESLSYTGTAVCTPVTESSYNYLSQLGTAVL